MNSQCSNDIPDLPQFTECATKADDHVNQRIIKKLTEQASGQPAFFAPPMTPWLEDYYHGRKLR